MVFGCDWNILEHPTIEISTNDPECFREKPNITNSYPKKIPMELVSSKAGIMLY